MKLAFSSNAYRNYSIEECINSIHLAGYDAIEIMCDTPHAFPPQSGKILKSKERKLFETAKIKLDVLKSEKIIGLN